MTEPAGVVTPLNFVLGMAGRWLAANYNPETTSDEEAWEACLQAVVPDNEGVVAELAAEVLGLYELGDPDAMISTNVWSEGYAPERMADPDLEMLRGLVWTYLVNLPRSGLWDTTADLNPNEEYPR